MKSYHNSLDSYEQSVRNQHKTVVEAYFTLKDNIKKNEELQSCLLLKLDVIKEIRDVLDKQPTLGSNFSASSLIFNYF